MRKLTDSGFKMAGISLLLAAIVLAGGCQTQRVADYRRSMTDGVRAVQAGELEQAEGCIENAKKNARGYEQQRQVQSMEQLIAGAQAMMDGRVELAKAAWSEIADPRLNLEVRRQADAVMGVEVPMIPDKKEN